MREQTMSGWKFRLPITSAISGTRVTAGAVRSLRQLSISWRLPIAAPKDWPHCRFRDSNTFDVGAGMRGLTSTMPDGKFDLNWLNNFADATHAAGLLKQAYGHIGAELKGQFVQILL